ncbi:MAG: NADH-ubiquinone oxidoreductase-F iron-sulfur binding region domain-containing protein, partial [Ilumatobacteraceae bacterium]
GGFAGPADLDLPLDDVRLREVGLTLGSGVVMVHDQHVDLVDQLRRIAAFFRDESCGQCVPCRVGTVRQEEAIERLASGTGEADLSLLRDIAGAMRDASICGLGQTAANAIQSAVVRLGVLT